ncbi:PaaI family thioesterase [Ferrovibrio sp. MS7]|uniref:PaaI family thioesterase n=1 Tax=Ferrovibrio plantarum TaxID=3119164 RepID=UPI00313648C1
MTFDPGQHGWKPERNPENPGYTGLVGPLWSRQEAEGQWAYAFLAEPKHLNARNLVHGGMLMTFADQFMGRTVYHAVNRQACVTVGLNSQFVAPAREGDLVEGRGRIVRRTRSLVFIQGSLTVAGAEVMVCDGIWKILGQ